MKLLDSDFISSFWPNKNYLLNFMAFYKLINTFNIGFKRELEEDEFYSVISKDISILSSAVIFSCNFHNTVARQ